MAIEKGTAGFSLGAAYDRMGFRGTAPRELIFEDCRVPRSSILGGEGGYLPLQSVTGRGGQLATAAIALGLARAAADAATKYAKERLQVGKQPLTSYQGIKFMLVDITTAVDAAQALVYLAARGSESAPPGPPIDCFRAKLFTTETAVEVTSKALQIHGGTGYCTDLPVERYYRDARGLTLHALPTEFLKDVIAMFTL